jgi:predicted nucleic acid-binding protein
MSLILDSSATLAWAFPDEKTAAIKAVFHMIAEDGAIVPELWRIEVANVLNAGIRRRRIVLKNRTDILAELMVLPISIDSETMLHTWEETLALADAYQLTLYDATYLELALRLGLPLATLDEALRDAAEREGVLLLGR